MRLEQFQTTGDAASFGRRKIAPRVCVVDRKQHIRAFLREVLEELGLIVCECTEVRGFSAVLDTQSPNLVIIGLSVGAIEAAELLQIFAAKDFDGKVLLLCPRNSPVIAPLSELGEALGIAMLPALETPFSAEGLRNSVGSLLPSRAPMRPPIDTAEALREGWLELWYQPKIIARTLAAGGIEALIRVRHPSWGVVPPAYFIPDDGDPQRRGFSEFVIGRAIEDWRHLVAQVGPTEIAINLPVRYLQDPASVRDLGLRMPDHPAFQGLIVEVNGADVVQNLELMKEVAGRLRFHKIAISIDDIGAEWPSLVGLHSFPFVELKVDRKFIAGVADDAFKQSVCREILHVADSYGARAVAEGVETRADFLAVREMGFDLVQGFLFAKPMAARKLAYRMLRPAAGAVSGTIDPERAGS